MFCRTGVHHLSRLSPVAVPVAPPIMVGQAHPLPSRLAILDELDLAFGWWRRGRRQGTGRRVIVVVVCKSFGDVGDHVRHRLHAKAL